MIRFKRLKEVCKTETDCTNFEIQTPSDGENGILCCCHVVGVSEERVEAMFPTAAVTSKMLKSGMTLTQIYNEYVQATDSLQLEKEENKRLNTYLDQILQVRRFNFLCLYSCYVLVYVTLRSWRFYHCRLRCVVSEQFQ